MREGKPKPQNTEFRFSKGVREKAKINDNPIVADLDMLQKKHSNILKTKGAVARLILAIKDDPTHFLDGSNPQNALLLKKLKDGKTGMIGVRREDTPENLIVHALKSSNKKEIERLVRRQMGRASLPTTLKNETGTGAKAHSSASGDIISQNSTKDEAAEQGSKLEQAGAKQEVVKGEGWTMRDGGAAKTDYTIKTDLAPNVRDLSKITVDEITADLEYLAAKHPEIFDKPSDVFKLIKEIKENPTHFFTNYRLDYALIVKRLEDNKIGKLAVDKQSGEVTHATKVRQRDLARMDRVSRQTVGTSTLPTPLSAADKNALKQDANSAGEAYSSATERIIPQNSAKDEETIKTYVNPHVGIGLAGGTLNAKDENGNFDAEKFAKGFIYGLFGSKVTAATIKKTNPKLYDQIVNIGKDKADKESLSGRVDKIKMPDMGKFLQKLIADKNISDKTKTQMIEAAKGRYAQEIKNEQTKKAIEASAQKGRNMTPIGRENLNAQIVEYVWNSKKTIAVDKLDVKRAKELNFKHPQDVRRTIGADAVTHVINRHGKDSDLVKKSGQKPVTLEDIAKWEEYADNASISAVSKDKSGQEVVVSGRQINGYYVIVEEIKKKRNELAFKTMFFEKGDIKNYKGFALGTD